MSKIICGIDPGLEGGIVIVDGDKLEQYVMPVIDIPKKGSAKARHEYDLQAIRRILTGADVDRERVDHVFIEKQQPMTKPQIKRCNRCGTIVETTQAQGIISTFNTGRGFGLLQGLVAGLAIPYTILAPQSWQPKMLNGVAGADSKAKALVVARQLFPLLDLRANDRCRVPHKGKVDALLICERGRRILGMEPNCEYDSELGF